jgi:hypothetical protein
MSLDSLVGVSLDTITPSRETAQRRLAAVARHIADARIKAVSGEARFCSAYTAIQSLQLTFGVGARMVARLDHLRKQRNVTEYSGDLVTDAEVAECMKQAEALYSFALGWLKKNKKDLL